MVSSRSLGLRASNAHVNPFGWLDVDAGKQLGRLDAQRGREAKQRVDARNALAALQEADLRSVEFRAAGERLLGNVGAHPARAEATAEAGRGLLRAPFASRRNGFPRSAARASASRHLSLPPTPVRPCL